MRSNIPWLIVGDFNEITNVGEKLGGGVKPQTQMDKFVQVINDCALQEIQYSGPHFTWSNGTTAERLGRGFFNISAMSKFPKAQVFHHDVGASDHF